ncbi:MAG: hypothetical protein GC193_07595 [Cryomorphaceae bacterium]|nr:hypothetical protein [Cryomorphaceae bacterium]
MSKQFELSELEVSEMRYFYEEEYVLLTRKLAHVTTMLEKLGGKAKPTAITPSLSRITKATVAKASAVDSYDEDDEEEDGGKTRRKRRKKRGPKSIWGAFILKRLRQLDRPISYSGMLDYAMVVHSIPEGKRENAKASILNSAFRLRTVHGKIDTVGEEGKKEKYLVLKRWTDGEGNLIEPYIQKFQEIVNAG